MKCQVCNLEFDLEKQKELCRTRCPKYGRCDLAPCPTCFFETVSDPEWYRAVFHGGVRLPSPNPA